MVFRVIEGGLSAHSPAAVDAAVEVRPSRAAVLEEAERRIKATGYETFRSRALMTGLPVPREVGYLAMQIRYVAEAISRLSDIPTDFRSDVYWPA